ncbi:MAG TPA: hypothetical protein VKH34_06985 [Vicinamibacterales bacterium]|nr:hypothetical protein [Vicinamibacterales bacterium]
MDAVLERQPDLYDADYWQQIYDMKPATLMVARTDESDVKQRQLVVYLDGERLGEIMFGESLRHEMLPGPHRIRISNTLVWKTIAFEAKPGEEVRFAAINRPGRFTYPMMVILGVGPLWLTVKRV